jgi:hypothetical protein
MQTSSRSIRSKAWTAPWFVAEVAESHRQRITAAQKPAVPPIGDEELLERLLDATGGNYLSGARGILDLAPIHAMLATGVTIDDILSTLRSKVDRGVTKYAGTLNSWAEPRFLRHVALAYLARTVGRASVYRVLEAGH